MIELLEDTLIFSFPEVHPEATLRMEFQRTLRIPDDGKDYPLPPGLGRFPMRHVDSYAKRVPGQWLVRGGVMLPMYQSEALWISFGSNFIYERGTSYPFAIKVAAGKINAVSGENWENGLHGNPQDYMVSPEQPWLDGFCVEKGYIRQFVAMPLGAGYSAEEQITGKAEFGGLQIIAYPMKREVFERRFPKITAKALRAGREMTEVAMACAEPDMGLAPGGRMRQEIYEDPYGIEDWDSEQTSRCFVHLANSLVWRAITGKNPPTVPPTSKEYTDAGLPWFDYYSDDSKPLKGSDKLAALKSISELGKEKGDAPLPENESVSPENIVNLRRDLKKNQVREGRF